MKYKVGDIVLVKNEIDDYEDNYEDILGQFVKIIDISNLLYPYYVDDGLYLCDDDIVGRIVDDNKIVGD